MANCYVIAVTEFFGITLLDFCDKWAFKQCAQNYHICVNNIDCNNSFMLLFPLPTNIRGKCDCHGDLNAAKVAIPAMASVYRLNNT